MARLLGLFLENHWWRVFLFFLGGGRLLVGFKGKPKGPLAGKSDTLWPSAKRKPVFRGFSGLFKGNLQDPYLGLRRKVGGGYRFLVVTLSSTQDRKDTFGPLATLVFDS